MAKVIALLSGGMDSTTLVAKLIHDGHEVEAVGVNYGQRHSKELDSAKAVAAHFGIPYDTVSLESLKPFLSGSALTDDVVVPDGHYAENTMRITVVPNRNAIMLSVVAGIAVARKAQHIATAIHSGDHYIYPDCRPEFFEAMSKALEFGTKSFGDISILAPFVNISKADIAAVGKEVSAPLELSWSCYKGGEIHCGACGTCFERREAFEVAGLDDPTVYGSTPHYDNPLEK